MIESIDKEMDLKLSEQNNPGSPTVIIIASSAVGCLPFISGLKTSKWRTIKLFAKHIKITQQKELLKKSFPIGVGTPNRIQQLVSYKMHKIIIHN